jgi:hypothetical protein
LSTRRGASRAQGNENGEPASSRVGGWKSFATVE